MKKLFLLLVLTSTLALGGCNVYWYGYQTPYNGYNTPPRDYNYQYSWGQNPYVTYWYGGTYYRSYCQPWYYRGYNRGYYWDDCRGQRWYYYGPRRR